MEDKRYTRVQFDVLMTDEQLATFRKTHPLLRPYLDRNISIPVALEVLAKGMAAGILAREGLPC